MYFAVHFLSGHSEETETLTLQFKTRKHILATDINSSGHQKSLPLLICLSCSLEEIMISAFTPTKDDKNYYQVYLDFSWRDVVDGCPLNVDQRKFTETFFFVYKFATLHPSKATKDSTKRCSNQRWIFATLQKLGDVVSRPFLCVADTNAAAELVSVSGFSVRN